MKDDPVPDPREGPAAAIRWFFRTDHEGVVFLREALSSAVAVIAVGMLLFAISGVWPPLVAVESSSMEPNMYPGDLVFAMDDDRFVPDAATDGTGIVTHESGVRANYQSFNDYGDVVIYKPYGSNRRTPVIHRARFHVDRGENWHDRANPNYITADTCAALSNCPAPHAGFITKGDNNRYYDQARGISDPVKPEWIRGTAEARIPWLGCVRLWFSGNAPAECQPFAG
jgi:signal peptidase